MPQMTEAYEWQGRSIVGSDGETIGRISEIYLDRETDRPEWAAVTSGLFGTKTRLVPLAGASPRGEDVHAPVTKALVQDAPIVDPDEQLSEQVEIQLFAHYGIPYSPEGSVTAEGQEQPVVEKAL